MKIKAKVAFGTGTLTLLLIISGLIGLYGTYKLGELLDFLTTQAWDTADGAMEAQIGIQAQVLSAYAFMNADKVSPDELRQAGKSAKDAAEMTEEALSRLKTAGLVGQDKVTKLDELLTRYHKAYAELLNDFTNQAAQIRFRKESNELLAYLVTFEEEGDSKVEGMMGQVKSTENMVHVMVTLALAIGLILATVIIMISNRVLILPLERTTAQMQDIAEGEGDLSVALEVKGNDEIADLSRAFNNFVGKIRDVVVRVADSTTQIATAA